MVQLSYKVGLVMRGTLSVASRHAILKSLGGLGIAWALVAVSLPVTPVSAQSPEIPVETEVVGVQPIIQRIELNGTVTSPHISQISTAVAGLVETVHFDSGAFVHKGQVLLELDADVERAQLEREQSQVSRGKIELADAERRLKIAKRLAKRAFGPKNAVEDREAEILTDRAALKSLEAQERRQAIIVERHTLKAPFDGAISRRMAEVGEWVQLGTPVFELVAINGLRVDVPVPQRYFAIADKSTDIRIYFDAIGEEPIAARIEATIPVSDPNARTFTLRVVPHSENLKITPGMSARVVLNLNTTERGIVISRDALIRHPDGRITVWVLEKKSDKLIVTERKIEIGLSFDGLVHVRSGLKKGEHVVVRGNEALREGQSVHRAS